MRLRKQISLFLSFAISITSMNVTALSNSISGMTKKAKAADIVLTSSPEPTNNASAAAMDADMRVILLQTFMVRWSIMIISRRRK